MFFQMKKSELFPEVNGELMNRLDIGIMNIGKVIQKN